jgi:hypothetical protein
MITHFSPSWALNVANRTDPTRAARASPQRGINGQQLSSGIIYTGFGTQRCYRTLNTPLDEEIFPHEPILNDMDPRGQGSLHTRWGKRLRTTFGVSTYRLRAIRGRPSWTWTVRELGGANRDPAIQPAAAGTNRPSAPRPRNTSIGVQQNGHVWPVHVTGATPTKRSKMTAANSAEHRQRGARGTRSWWGTSGSRSCTAWGLHRGFEKTGREMAVGG